MYFDTPNLLQLFLDLIMANVQRDSNYIFIVTIVLTFFSVYIYFQHFQVQIAEIKFYGKLSSETKK